MLAAKDETTEINKTPLYDIHVEAGAKMVPFAGFLMPIQYDRIIDEHTAVRNAAGLFDVSHMGEFEFRGPGAQDYLQYLTANNVAKLEDGKAQYSLLCNEAGGIVDDILLYRLTADHFIMVVNAANIDKDWAWVTQHQPDNVTIENLSNAYALIAFQGPKAITVLEKVTDLPIASLKPFHFLQGSIAGQANCIIAATGYTGEAGVEIFCSPAAAPIIWQQLVNAGQAEGVRPIGLGARDTLRLEARLSLYGNDLTDETNPLEAGLSWVVKLDKPNDFIGKQSLLTIKEKGLQRKLVGFKMLDKAIARHGYSICQNGEKIGEVTSGSHSPTLGYAIGLGYVPLEATSVGTQFNIDIRNRMKLAEVVPVPFYKRK